MYTEWELLLNFLVRLQWHIAQYIWLVLSEYNGIKELMFWVADCIWCSLDLYCNITCRMHTWPINFSHASVQYEGLHLSLKIMSICHLGYVKLYVACGIWKLARVSVLCTVYLLTVRLVQGEVLSKIYSEIWKLSETKYVVRVVPFSYCRKR